MRIELIQPFINAADAVIGETLQCTAQAVDVSMDEEVYRKTGLAARVSITGDIEGRVIFDVTRDTAAKVAVCLSGADTTPDDDLVRETVCELANLVIGNAVTSLNDQGFRFKVHPPEFHASEAGLKGSEDTEALVMRFDTPAGSVFMNIAMQYHHRRRQDGQFD